MLSKKPDSALTHKILAHLEKFPEVLYESIDDIIYWWSGYNHAFNIAFPYIASNDEYRNKIIDHAIRSDKIFDSIMPYLSYKDQCSALTLTQPDQCFESKDYYCKSEEHFSSNIFLTTLTNQQDENGLIGEILL